MMQRVYLKPAKDLMATEAFMRSEAGLLCEVRLLLPPYLELRKRTNIFRRLLRVPTHDALLDEFA